MDQLTADTGVGCSSREEAVMPLTAKGKKIKRNMDREYGKKKGDSVFYASMNAGKIKGVEGRRGKARKRG